MHKEKRISRGEKNFQKYIIPSLKEEFPGVWQSTNRTLVDMKYGIDFYYTHGQETLSIAARVWNCHPKPHFSARWKKNQDPKQPLEVSSRLKGLKDGSPMSNLTIEGFIWDRWIYVAWIDSKLLWEAVEVNLENLNHFPVKNQEGGHTLFKQVPFSLFGAESIKKKVQAII
tara:strand:+ start:2045 stop:2557 length:513 start_codon:yes stop_codon:yes gene_type:complete